MANFTNKKKDRNYIKGSAKEVTFTNGGSIIHVDMLLDDILKLPVNKSGYIKITISSLTNPDKFGNTHSIYENDFVAASNAAGKAGVVQPQAPTTASRRGAPSTDNTYPF